MGISIFCLIFTVLDVLRVCQALKCTPLTGNTCTKSLYVTGQCISGECECVVGMVPGDYGCHEPFKPNVSVTFPVSWSGEIHSDGYVIIQCNPDSFQSGNYKWYQNGTEIENEEGRDIVVRNPKDTLEIQCAIKAYGVFTDRSNSFILEVGKIDQPFTKRPFITGMPISAAINSTITLYCNNIPASYTWIIWHVNGERIPKVYSRTITLAMSADKFNSTVMCIVDHRNRALNVYSDHVSTPIFPAVDIPGVIIKGENRYNEKGTLVLNCEISESFALSPLDEITYAWRGPDGNDIVGATSHNYVKGWLTIDDSGTYSCRASYNNRAETVSPDFFVIVDDEVIVFPVVQVKPSKAVLGGYTSLICKVPGYDPSSFQYEWQIMTSRFQMIPLLHYRDNTIQINNIQRNVQKVYICKISLGSASFGFLYDPVPMSESIKPTVVEVNDTQIEATHVLSCHSDYETRGIIFEWFIDDTKQVNQTSKKIGVDAKVTSTTVRCRVSFNSDPSALSEVFSIPPDGSIAPPVIGVTGEPPSYIAGASYELVCSSISHNSNASYSWRKGDSDLGVSSRTLTLSNIQDTNNGDYSCRIMVGDQYQYAKTALKIVVSSSLDPPVVEAVGSPSLFVLGQSYTLMCSGQPRKETAMYGWKKDSADLRVNIKNLNFSNVQPINNGNYTCSITIGDVTAVADKPLNFTVTSVVPPVIELVENPRAFVIGGSYSFICSSPSHQPAATYSWKKGVTDLNSSERIFTIDNIQKGDNGMYSCTISLNYGSEPAQQPLKVLVTDDGRYCTSASDCTGEGFNNTVCEELQCQCLSHYTLRGNKCVISGAISPSLTTVTIMFALVIILIMSLQ